MGIRIKFSTAHRSVDPTVHTRAKPTDLDGEDLLLHRVLDREAEDLHVPALPQAVDAVDRPGVESIWITCIRRSWCDQTTTQSVK